MTLTEQMKSLVNDIASTRDDRTAAVARIKKDTEQLLDGSRVSLKETRARVRQMLVQTKADRKRHLANLRQTFQRERQVVAADMRGASRAWQRL